MLIEAARIQDQGYDVSLDSRCKRLRQHCSFVSHQKKPSVLPLKLPAIELCGESVQAKCWYFPSLYNSIAGRLAFSVLSIVFYFFTYVAEYVKIRWWNLLLYMHGEWILLVFAPTGTGWFWLHLSKLAVKGFHKVFPTSLWVDVFQLASIICVSSINLISVTWF